MKHLRPHASLRASQPVDLRGRSHGLVPAARDSAAPASRHWLGAATVALAAITAAAAACRATDQERSVRPGINQEFQSPDLDVDKFVQRFEGESREIAVHRDQLVDILDLRPGMAVADVGAGTGLFLQPFARAVGPRGRVFAVDISPRFVEHLRERVTDEGLAQVRVVRCNDHSVELPDASVDVAFVCDTYHHFEYPRATLASLHRALRPGGRLVIIDFKRVPGVSSEWVLEHVRAGQEQVTEEIEAGGFRLLEELHLLKDNYVLRFERMPAGQP